MNRFVLFLIVLMTAGLPVYAQNHTDNELDVRNRITRRDTADIKKKDLVDTLTVQVADYKLLVEFLEKRLEALHKKHAKTDSLLTADVSVFYHPIPDSIPFCLKPYYELVRKIMELRMNIEGVEKKIKDTEKLTSNTQINEEDWKELVRKIIDPDMMKINDIFTAIDSMNLSSLSPAQAEFYKPGLTERYNKFLIYFE